MRNFSSKRHRTAILHIGMGKTGSTTIQNVLFAARETLLSEEQVLYPSIAANHSVYLKTLFEESATSILPMLDPIAASEEAITGTRDQFRASLEKELSRSDWRKAVISAEGLSDFGPEGAGRLVQWLGEYADDIQIVAYVRHPVDWARSMVQQRLKTGDTLDEMYRKLPGPRWRKRFTPWLDIVGRERFGLISFDEARNSIGILSSFCDAVGLPYERVAPFAPTSSVNESMSLEAVLLLDSLNRQRPLLKNGKLSPERLWRGTGLIKSIPGSKFRLSQRMANKIHNDAHPDLEWLNETFGTDLYPDVFEDLSDDAPDAPPTIPQETVDALVLTLSRYGNRIKRLEERLSRL